MVIVFFNDTATTEIYTLSLHDALPILMKVDNNILKLDTVDIDYIRLVDRPTQTAYQVDKIIEELKAFHGHVIIQTMFMKGSTVADGQVKSVDNTGQSYVMPWLKALKEIRPSAVMIYTIDRETPDHRLLKATPAELDAICSQVKAAGIACTASY